MIKLNVTPNQQAEFAMPISGTVRVASVRALPVMGDVSAFAAGRKFRVDSTAVCGYRHTADVVVLTGAFPGTSAWSPPI